MIASPLPTCYFLLPTCYFLLATSYFLLATSYLPMVPSPGPERDRASQLLSLERELFGAWCQLTFQPGKGLMDRNERAFLSTLQVSETPSR